MKKIIFIMIIIFFISFLLYSDGLILRKTFKPSHKISIDNQYIFIPEISTRSIVCYSLKDGKYIMTLGKRGEGPGEFRSCPSLIPLKDKFFLYSNFKITYFTKKGKYLKEYKLKNNINYIYPFGKGYAVLRMNSKDWTYVVEILNSNLEKLKEVYKVQLGNPLKSMDPTKYLVKIAVYKKRLYIMENDKGFIIKVFDTNGNSVQTIKNSYNKIKISKAFKLKFMKHMKESNKAYWNILKNLIKFPEFFPPMKDLIISNDKIYVEIPNNSEQFNVFKVFSIKGKFIKKLKLPFADIRTINNNRYYYIKSDDNDNQLLYSLNIE